MSVTHSIADALNAHGWYLATAESCTGGGIGAALTDLPGSSSWYRGGVIAYDNAVKRSFLNVPEDILSTYGAVSEPVVVQMAVGVAELIGAEASIATSGIAGPSGGTEAKPVGTVCFAYKAGDQVWSETLCFGGDRANVRRLAIEHGLTSLLSRL